MRIKFGFHIAVATLGLALAATGAWAMYAETDAYLSGDSSAARVAAWTVSPPHPGLSVTTQNQTLLDCADVLAAPNALPVRYLAADVRARLAPACRDLATAIAADTPTSAFAWYVAAQASATLADWPALNHALRRSYLTGPTEQWLADRRVALAEAHLVRLDPDTAAAHRADLHLLLHTPRGLAAIATRYHADPGFRPRIAAIAETLPAPDQQRFLDTLTAAR